MARRPIRVSISRKDRKSLDELLSSGVQPVRVVLRALALIHLGDGSTAPGDGAVPEETDGEGGTVGRPPLSGRRLGSSHLRKVEAGRGSVAESVGKAAYCR